MNLILKKKQQSVTNESLEIIPISEQVADDYWVYGKAVSVYNYDKCLPMDEKELVIAATELQRVFKIDEVKADYTVQIMAESNWSKERFKDAIKHVLKTNIYPNVEPGLILNYDRQYKYYTYDEMLEFGTGGYGFKPVKIPFDKNTKESYELIDGKTYELVTKEIPFFVKTSDNTPFEDWNE